MNDVKVTRTKYPGWDQHPAYYVKNGQDFNCVDKWMREQKISNFLLASGTHGYVFQVRNDAALFELRWL